MGCLYSRCRVRTLRTEKNPNMKIHVASKNGNRFEMINTDETFAQIRKFNGRAQEHTLSPSEMETHIKRINRKIDAMSEINRRMINPDGMTFSFHTGAIMPNSYRYSRIVNKVVYGIKKKKLMILTLEKKKVLGNSVYSTDGVFILPKKTRKKVSDAINNETV